MVEPIQQATQQPVRPRPLCCARPGVIGLASAGSLIAGAILILTGKRQAGLVAAASGAALAAVDQREILAEYWRALPGYIDETQKTLNKVQDSIHEIDVRRQRLNQILSR